MFIEASFTSFTIRKPFTLPVRLMLYSPMIYHFTKAFKCVSACEPCNSVYILNMFLQISLFICLKATFLTIKLSFGFPLLPVLLKLLPVICSLCCNRLYLNSWSSVNRGSITWGAVGGTASWGPVTGSSPPGGYHQVPLLGGACRVLFLDSL